MSRSNLLILATMSLIGTFVMPHYPVNSGLSRLLFLLSVVGVWFASVSLFWNIRAVRIVLVLLPVLVTILILLAPASTPDPEEIRSDYVRRMGTMEETRYLWGGEGSFGIDCSGLPRRALRDALLAYGIRHGNTASLRLFVEQWWFDASADALGHGYRDYTIAVGISGTIRDMDYSTLVPGDLAVTNDGVHVMAYMGGEDWIQAEPTIGAVVTRNGRKDDNHWFKAFVSIHRWRVVTGALLNKK